MTPTRTTGPTAALAGIMTGLQAQGVWSGRRQILVRFAGEAETATMYIATALANELRRLSGRFAFHSVSLSGRDPLGNAEFLQVGLAGAGLTLPVLLDCDGQRPEAIPALRAYVSMIQITTDAAGAESAEERVLASLSAARAAGCDHALVIASTDQTSDAQIVRLIERARGASDAVTVVIHPPPIPAHADGATDAPGHELARRWSTLMEAAVALHPDVRLALRLPAPAGMR